MVVGSRVNEAAARLGPARVRMKRSMVPGYMALWELGNCGIIECGWFGYCCGLDGNVVLSVQLGRIVCTAGSTLPCGHADHFVLQHFDLWSVMIVEKQIMERQPSSTDHPGYKSFRFSPDRRQLWYHHPSKLQNILPIPLNIYGNRDSQ